MIDCKRDIYDPEDKKENKIYRYALGKKGDNMIICIALNPSSATNIETDPTLRAVCNIAKNNKYKGFVLLNICPKRGVNPDLVKCDEEFINKNILIIEKYLKEYEKADIWCAWGNKVDQEPFRACFKSIAKLIGNRIWYCTSLTKKNHPHHPLFIPYKSTLKKLSNIEKENYIKHYEKD